MVPALSPLRCALIFCTLSALGFFWRSTGGHFGEANASSFRHLSTVGSSSDCDDSTFFPRVVEARLQERYPPHLRLRLVQIVHRHGERAPTGDHFPALKLKWPLCASPRTAALYHHDASPELQSDFELLSIAEPAHAAKKNSTCLMGQLTDKGKRSLLRVGEWLRHVYVDQARFLPQTWDTQGLLSVRATDHIRTHHSVLSLLLGLYPRSTRSAAVQRQPVGISVMPPGKEYLYPSYTYCPRSGQLWHALQKADNELPKLVADLRRNFSELAALLDAFPLPKSVPWSASALQAAHDTLSVMRAHGYPWPDGIGTAAYSALDKALVREWWHPLQQSEDLCRLVAGPALHDILWALEHPPSIFGAPVDGAAPRFRLISAHDSTLAPLLVCLGVFDGHWPPYASTLAFEILQDTRESDGEDGPVYVRVVFNDRVVTPPFCKGPEQANPVEELCPWNRFQAAVRRLVPSNHAAECVAQEEQ